MDFIIIKLNKLGKKLNLYYFTHTIFLITHLIINEFQGVSLVNCKTSRLRCSNFLLPIL